LLLLIMILTMMMIIIYKPGVHTNTVYTTHIATKNKYYISTTSSAEFFNAGLGALHGHLNLQTPPGSVHRTVVKALNSAINLKPTPSRAAGGI
jgi:hypothetical protein